MGNFYAGIRTAQIFHEVRLPGALLAALFSPCIDTGFRGDAVHSYYRSELSQRLIIPFPPRSFAAATPEAETPP
ncbi:MAG TPA: hypothetical protein VLK82_28650 [Candidatus Tectomicrobia bacterium]|nr:hypothetical protein [Candidatus Tectomicrobia bacterium]